MRTTQSRANDGPVRLDASVWTADRERGERLANRINAGCVYVNQLTKSDPRVPFGGIGDSGYGRELSETGIESSSTERRYGRVTTSNWRYTMLACPVLT